MTTLTGVPLIEGIDVAATLTAILTNTASTRMRVDNITFTNYSALPQTLTVQIIESGGSAGNPNIVLDNIPIPAGESISPVEVLHGLNTGDEIRAIAGTVNTINVRATGTTFG